MSERKRHTQTENMKGREKMIISREIISS
jgi:hypothetical protein